MEQKKQLNIIVNNTKDLESGVSSSFQFDESGGIIGSRDGAQWQLKGNGSDIHPEHCQVLMQDDNFCIKDLCGYTYINGSTTAIGAGEMAKLNHKDTIVVGRYELLISGDSSGDYLQSHSQPLDQMFGQETELLQDGEFSLVEKDKEEVERTDPIELLGGMTETEEAASLLGNHDKTQVREDESNWLLADHENDTDEDPVPQADSEFEISSAIKLKKKSGSGFFSAFSKSDSEADLKETETVKKAETVTAKKNPIELNKSTHFADNQSGNNVQSEVTTEGYIMDEKELDLLEEEFSQSRQYDNQSLVGSENNHLLSGPLFRGLGVPAAAGNQTADIQMISEEIGAALQAAIKGLLELHRHVDSGRYGVINKNLQPIEDNPLRLGLPYEETVQTLFNNQPGAVHLSAPSAINESLKNLKDHNDVVQIATTLALSQIVQAFSPQTLMKRFERYRRSSEIPQQNKEAWAWEMYQNYYRELTSDHQQGFEKLFWEVFDQAYDRLLREKQTES